MEGKEPRRILLLLLLLLLIVVVVVVVVTFFNKNFDNRKATLALKHLKHKTQYRPERCTYYVVINELIMVDKKNKVSKCISICSTIRKHRTQLVICHR